MALVDAVSPTGNDDVMTSRGALPETVPDESLLLRFRDHFASHGLPHHARWMTLELDGYDPKATVRSLPELMRGAPPEIFEAVSRARIRRGRVRVGEDGSIITWPHFFVEPVRELRHLGARIGPVAGEILIDLAPGHGEPPTLAFTGNVILDVLETIGIEIRAAARTAS